MKKIISILISIVTTIGTLSVVFIVFNLSNHPVAGTSFGGGTSFGPGGFTNLTVSAGGSGVGTISTTTFTLGDISTTTSASCINMKTNLGASTSLMVIGTTLTVLSGNCR